MAKVYKTSEKTAQIIDSMHHLYDFYNDFSAIFEGDPRPGQVLEDDFQDKWHAFKDCVLLLIAYRLEYALMESPDGTAAPEVVF